MTAALHGAHLETYQAIFRHPAAHNLGWRDVRAMLAAIAEVMEESNGALKITRNGQTLILHPHREKDITEMQELMQLRHFLQRSGADALDGASPATADKRHLLVVIDHREARVYETELHGALPHRIHPYDPHGAGRHLHYVEDDFSGQRKPESNRFYEAVIKTLHDAEQILIFGAGTGASSAMDRLLAELKLHHKALASRVIGTVVVDETHLTEDQLLAKAREVYDQVPVQKTHS